MLIPLAAPSKSCVCGHSLAGSGDSNPARDMDVCLVLVLLCCLVEVSTTGRSRVQRSPTECGVSERDREASTVRMPIPTGTIEL